MTDPMTDADLDAIEQRLKDSNGLGDYPCCDEYTEDYIDTLAASASDVPALLAEVRRLRAADERVREYARSIRYVDGMHYEVSDGIYEALDGGE